MGRQLARIGGTAASVALTLGLIEGATRALHLAPALHRIDLKGRDSAYRISTNSLLGIEFKENYRGHSVATTSDFDYTNAFGQRDRERTLAKIPGTRRIAMLGDSVLVGSGGIPTVDQTISRELEKLFEGAATGAGRTEVLNFGVGGYCTLSEAELFRTKARAFHPDLVIVLFVNNDYDCMDQGVATVRGIRFNGWSYPRPELIDKLFVASHFFRAVSLRFDLFNLRTEVDPLYFDERHARAVGDASDSVRRGLSMLKAYSDEDGFKLLVVVWPEFNPANIDDHWGHPVVEGPSGSRRLAVEAAGEQFGIPVVRLSSEFRGEYRARPGQSQTALYTIGDGMHPNPLGARVAAKLIREILRRQLGW